MEQEKEQQQLLAEVRRTAVEGAGLDTGGTEAAGYGTAEAAGQVGGSHGGDAEAVVSPTAKRCVVSSHLACTIFKCLTARCNGC